MNTYLIRCDDWRLLEESPETICAQFERYIDSEARYFAPVLFAEYSCLTQYVYEEIDLIISSQEAHGDARMSQDEFIEFWDWRRHLEHKVYHLSGGWRKLLALSMFLNRKSQNVIIVDFAAHLSDATIASTLNRMPQLQIENAAFVEYDIAIVNRLLSHPQLLRQAGTRLIDVNEHDAIT